MVPWCRELRKSQHFPAVDQKMLLKIEMWRNVKKCCQTEVTKQRFVVCVVSIQSEFFPRGILNKVLYGHTPLWKGPTPYPFKNHFRRQKYPFRMSSIDKWYPIHLPSLEIASFFYMIQYTVKPRFTDSSLLRTVCFVLQQTKPTVTSFSISTLMIIEIERYNWQGASLHPPIITARWL